MKPVLVKDPVFNFGQGKKFPQFLSQKPQKPKGLNGGNVELEPYKKGCSALATLQIGPSLQAARWEFLTF